MSRRTGLSAKMGPDWSTTNGMTYNHARGGWVTRAMNPTTKLIEWTAVSPPPELAQTWHGQDLASAMEYAT